ncbi:MAG: glycosyltransferase [Patescibacteria group bacterium]
MLPLVSVIITTKNEAKVIERLLVSLRSQSYKNIEIILIDNDSTDSTTKIAKKFTNKVYNFGPERSAQRNFGVKKAQGIHLLFLDADMELSDKVIEECISSINSSTRFAGVIIPEKSVAKTFWEEVKAFERSFYNEKGDEITDAARFFRKSIFKKAGGYDETITGPEDWDLPETIKKLGYAFGRISAVIYHHERINSPFDLAKKKYFYALRAHRYLKKHHISIFSPKTIYFLRPIFYKNFDRIISHPILSLGMFIMLFFQILGGGLGYLVGRIKNL